MFGIGGSEIIVILIVALIFLGPDKLPHAAKEISKGIRELKKGSRVLTETIENDEKIGGAIRDIKSALRGEDPPPPRPRPKKKKKRPVLVEGDIVIDKPVAAVDAANEAKPAEVKVEVKPDDAPVPLEPPKPTIKLPETAGEPHPDVPANDPAEAREELAAMIRPAEGTVPKVN